MNDNIDNYWNRMHLAFEGYFDYKKISAEHVSFARHYIENEMGIDIDSETLIEFAPIRVTVFGFLIAHLAEEFEKYNNERFEAGFKTSPPDEE